MSESPESESSPPLGALGRMLGYGPAPGKEPPRPEIPGPVANAAVEPVPPQPESPPAEVPGCRACQSDEDKGGKGSRKKKNPGDGQ